MSTYRPTPVLCEHARERCAEMGISTKVAKRIVREAAVVRPGMAHSDRLVAVSDTYPAYAVVYVPGEPDLIVTVLFRTQVLYLRDGSGYVERPSSRSA